MLGFRRRGFEVSRAPGVGSVSLAGKSVIVIGSSGSANPGGFPLLFQDDFETGNLSHTENGILWGNSTNAAVVTVPGTNVAAFAGSRSIRFTNAGSANTFTDTISEQRLNLGQAWAELYFEYVLYYPGNGDGIGAPYAHRNNAAAPDNNKFFRCWRGNHADGNDGYNGGGFSFYQKVGSSLERSGAGGISYNYVEYGTNGSIGRLGPTGSGPLGASFDPWVSSGELGTWMTVLIHVKAATSANNNGVVEISKNGTKLISSTNLPIYPAHLGASADASNGFDFMYFEGAAQSGYDSTTYKFIDSVKVYGTGF